MTYRSVITNDSQCCVNLYHQIVIKIVHCFTQVVLIPKEQNYKRAILVIEENSSQCVPICISFAVQGEEI